MMSIFPKPIMEFIPRPMMDFIVFPMEIRSEHNKIHANSNNISNSVSTALDTTAKTANAIMNSYDQHGVNSQFVKESSNTICKVAADAKRGIAGVCDNFFRSVGSSIAIHLLAHKLVASICRTTLVVLSALVFSKITLSPITFLATLIVSVPCTVMLVGGWLLNHGITAIVAFFAKGAFISLGIGFITATTGWLILLVHDFFPIGILELAINQISKSYSERVAKFICS